MVSWVLILLWFGLPSAAPVQSQSGAVAGVVKDTQGVALAGVTVEASSPTLIERTRTGITDSQGRYRIDDLKPGTYTIRYVREGFNVVSWNGVELVPAFLATINVEMRAGAAEETVSALPTSVDARNVSQQAVTSRAAMDALPTDRTYISYAALTPGMQVVGGVQNVGGALAETAQMLRIHGTRIGESRLFVDGMSVMSGNGAGGLNLGNFMNNAMAQEVVVNTGSLTAEFEVAGVTSNLITREGSNVFRGGFSGRYTNGALQDRNLSTDLIARGLTSANRIVRIWDANPSAGGPIVKDRLWLFSSVRHWGTYNTIAGLYDDVDPAALFYTPDLSKPSVYPVHHASGDARLTLRVTPRSRIGAYYHAQRSDFGTCTSPAPTRQTAPSGCPHFKSDPQWFAQVSWSSPLTRRLLVEAGATTTTQNFTGRQDPGVPADLSSITESTTNFTWRAPTAGFGGTFNRQSNYRASLSAQTGRHSSKVGLTLLHQWRVTGAARNNAVNYTFADTVPGVLTSAIPTFLTQFAEPATYAERVNYNLGLYAQDQWTVSRLTVNLGVRADFLNAQVDAQTLAAGPFVPARDFPEIRNVPNWRDLSPRLGVAADPFGTGKTTIKATLGRYVVGEAYTIARTVNPVDSTISSTLRTWNDRRYPEGDPRRGNFVPDCDLTNVAENGECGPTDTDKFGQLVVSTRYDSVVTEGFGVRPYNWAASVSVEHQVVPQVTVFAGYFRRWYGNFSATRNLAVTNGDFSPFCITSTDPLRPAAGPVQMCGFFDVNPGKFGQTDNLIAPASRFGEQESVFDGFDFTLSARLPNRAMIAGGLGVGRERTNTCYAIEDRSLSFRTPGVVSPRTSDFCNVHPPMQPNLKVQAVYPLPWWGIQTAATFQSLSGPELLAQQSTSNAQIRPSLGRNLALCGTAEPCTSRVTLDLIPPGTLYGDRVNQVDFRLSKAWTVGRTIVRPAVSIYNLLNANPVLQYNNRFNASWPAPTAILTARFVDFGVHVEF